MPHKRAKRTVREKQQTQSGLNLPPGARHAIDHEEIPKGAARILNATKVQEEYKQRKRKLQESGGDAEPSKKKRKSEGRHGGETGSEGKGKLRIQAGESMAHFNRRVEDSMRGGVRVAMKNSSALARKVRKEEEVSKAAKTSKKGAPAPGTRVDDDAETESDKTTAITKPSTAGKQKPEDFERLSTSAPRRLNDIVQGPPELKKLSRGVKQRPKPSADSVAGEGAGTLRQGALSMAQKAILEEERLRAIKMYREMKKAKSGG
ncbi:uncharacterized protein C8Q71DRAFT_761590 [Rhodofomes roseus]|uniref:Uncharacterized protein n=1 Tax=Rhodofomes roseus TaxID=34475 RepID=A0ABQ8KG70_9APHY|nr:uncharacterized protein C8Q71DRAFT_761590 [Rhodofomes roseus]KAH9836281.1 hypothetical protein C8Q71DRAFT_761590 [Rhodofomes roseus]